MCLCVCVSVCECVCLVLRGMCCVRVCVYVVVCFCACYLRASGAHKCRTLCSRGANIVERGLKSVISCRTQARHCPTRVCPKRAADAPRRAH